MWRPPIFFYRRPRYVPYDEVIPYEHAINNYFEAVVGSRPPGEGDPGVRVSVRQREGHDYVISFAVTDYRYIEEGLRDISTFISHGFQDRLLASSGGIRIQPAVRTNTNYSHFYNSLDVDPSDPQRIYDYLLNFLEDPFTHDLVGSDVFTQNPSVQDNLFFNNHNVIGEVILTGVSIIGNDFTTIYPAEYEEDLTSSDDDYDSEEEPSDFDQLSDVDTDTDMQRNIEDYEVAEINDEQRVRGAEDIEDAIIERELNDREDNRRRSSRTRRAPLYLNDYVMNYNPFLHGYQQPRLRRPVVPDVVIPHPVREAVANILRRSSRIRNPPSYLNDYV